MKVRMLRTVGECHVGQVYEIPHPKDISWVEAGIASLRLEAAVPGPPVEAEPDVEVLGGAHGRAPKKAPRRRMVERARQKRA